MTKNLQNIKESFEKLLEKYKAELKAEQVRELVVKKKIEDLTGDIARVMKNLQAVDNIKERE
jgi:predicted helicase